MLTFDNFHKVIIQEKKGKTISELGYWIFKWQDMKIIISPCGRGLEVTCMDQFDKILSYRDGTKMKENTNLSMYELSKTKEMWEKAIGIANKFYDEKSNW